MTDRPLVIDAFCCAGGSGMGWRRAGFEVVGVDHEPQPRYPFEFIQGDVFEVIPLLLRTHQVALLTGSPPCRDHTSLKKRRQNWDAGLHVSVTGDVGTYVGREALGIDWMTGNELSQAIPPVYTAYLGTLARWFL